MDMQVVHGDVLAADADALILTIDGAKRGMEGNIARAFVRRWPVAWAQVEESVSYPLRLGGATAVRLDDRACPFRWILVASTLHHLETLEDDWKLAVVRQALHRCLELAVHHRVRQVATAVMCGGWRLTPDAAFMAMTATWRGFASRNRLRLTVCTTDAAFYEQCATQDLLNKNNQARPGEAGRANSGGGITT